MYWCLPLAILVNEISPLHKPSTQSDDIIYIFLLAMLPPWPLSYPITTPGLALKSLMHAEMSSMITTDMANIDDSQMLIDLDIMNWDGGELHWTGRLQPVCCNARLLIDYRRSQSVLWGMRGRKGGIVRLSDLQHEHPYCLHDTNTWAKRSSGVLVLSPLYWQWL